MLTLTSDNFFSYKERDGYEVFPARGGDAWREFVSGDGRNNSITNAGVFPAYVSTTWCRSLVRDLQRHLLLRRGDRYVS